MLCVASQRSDPIAVFPRPLDLATNHLATAMAQERAIDAEPEGQQQPEGWQMVQEPAAQQPDPPAQQPVQQPAQQQPVEVVAQQQPAPSAQQPVQQPAQLQPVQQVAQQAAPTAQLSVVARGSVSRAMQPVQSAEWSAERREATELEIKRRVDEAADVPMQAPEPTGPFPFAAMPGIA